jgi:hypothetical protein
MIPNNVVESVREGDLGGDAIAMSFDENSFAHLMSVLTDLYKDPELAVIREYSTNARDAHIEAGKVDRPIEVFTPTSLFPFFRVKDYGIGLDHDGIRDVYSKYGASSKRGSNDATGMLGLGCKSGLTYTNQFTVIGIKNGVKTTVVVSRNEDGSGVMQVVDTCATDEEAGVEINIPAKRGDFGIKVPGFFRYWPKGSVLINGKPNEVMGYTMVSDNIGWTREDNMDRVIMGGVAYEIDSHRRPHDKQGYKGYGIHFTVPMGSVNFTPSREGLHYTAKTIKFLEGLYEDFDKNLADAAQVEVTAAKTKADAWALAAKWRNTFSSVKNWNFTYQGMPVPQSVKMGGYHMRSKYGRGYWVNWNGTVDHSIFADGNKIIVNYPTVKDTAGNDVLEKFEGIRRTRVDRYIDEVLVEDWQNIYVVRDMNDPWLADIPTIDWTAIVAWKMPRKNVNGSSKTFVEPAYEVTQAGGGTKDIKKSDIEALVAAGAGDIVYFSTQGVHAHRVADRPEAARNLAQYITKLGPVVVLLGENRWDKFVRDFPNAKKGHVWMKEYLESNEKAMSDDEKLFLAINNDYTSKRKFSRLARVVGQIDDPQAVKMVKGTSATLSTYAKDRDNLWLMYGRFTQGRQGDQPVLPATSYFNKMYPLVDDDSPVADAVLYMNAKFASTTKDGK